MIYESWINGNGASIVIRIEQDQGRRKILNKKQKSSDTHKHHPSIVIIDDDSQ